MFTHRHQRVLQCMAEIDRAVVSRGRARTEVVVRRTSIISPRHQPHDQRHLDRPSVNGRQDQCFQPDVVSSPVVHQPSRTTSPLPNEAGSRASPGTEDQQNADEESRQRYATSEAARNIRKNRAAIERV